MSKFEVGVSSGKLNDPPKSCIPRRAKMKMNKKSRNRRDIMEDKAFIRAITRLRRGDQYLQGKERENVIVILAQNDAAFLIAVVTLKCSTGGDLFQSSMLPFRRKNQTSNIVLIRRFGYEKNAG